MRLGSKVVVGVPYITIPISSGLGRGLTRVAVSGLSVLSSLAAPLVARALQLVKPRAPMRPSAVPMITLERKVESRLFIMIESV